MNLVYKTTWYTGHFIFWLVFRWRVYHVERMPQTGPVVIAVNHASFLDPPLVGCSAPRVINYLARESLFRFPIVGWYLRKLQAVPVDRDGGGGAGLKAILDRLAAGGAILLFPEGTRTRDGKLQPAKAGVGLTVIKSEAPVIPVRIWGAYEAYSRHHTFPRPRKIIVKYGEPLYFAELRAEAKQCSKQRLKQIYQEVADGIMAAMASMEPHADEVETPKS